jgi:hypothetical protein
MKALISAAGGIVIAALSVAVSDARQPQQPQYSQFHKPMAPIGPTSEAQCAALQTEWSRLCQQITDTHQRCLDANTNPAIKGAGKCSKAPCLQLHNEMDACGGAEQRQAVDACHASVRNHKDREAQFRRAQEEAVRAQQQVERERKARLDAEAARYTLEADRQRQVAQAYRRDAAKAPVRTEMSDHQAAMLAALQQRAEAAARENRRALSLPREHDFVDNNTLPDLSKRAALIGKLGKALGQMGVAEGAEVVGWFTAIHDARRAAAENARLALNDSLRRDFPNERTFNFGDCNTNRVECQRFSDRMSPESRQKQKEYDWAAGWYFGWTDLGNVTGKGWTQHEQAQFLQKVGESGVKRITKWIGEEVRSQNPTWEKFPTSPVSDAVNGALKKQIDKHLGSQLNQPNQPSGMVAKSPDWYQHPPDLGALDAYWRELKRWENQRFLEDYLQQLPSVPVPLTPAPPVVGLPIRR